MKLFFLLCLKTIFLRIFFWSSVVAPQIAQQLSFGDEPINAGEIASIQCAVLKGDLPLEITWMFNDKPITRERTDVTVSSSGKRLRQLTIESVNAGHAGEYTCVASNVAGSTSKSALLHVNGTLA